ncbi:hypothetical protein GCM10023187_32090 [Nibrella viscosa]|uniref:Ig-like domain-containing protein n=1 Tax=Nibrella viscosa TaxID=1084524 RepID=A0ABP8KLR9_9BACT
MKQLLFSTPLKRIRPVFFNVGENVKRYEQVRGLFVDGHDRLFAEPLVTGAGRDEITWYSDYQGKPTELPAHSPEEQQRLLPVLNDQVNYLFRDIIRYIRKGPGQYDRAGYRTLRQSVESFLEVPSVENILVFQTPDGPRFTLTNWGFMSEKEKPERNIIRNLIPFGVTPVILQARYKADRSPAANEPLQIEFDGYSGTLTTDEHGRITVTDVPYLSEVTVYQTNADGQAVNRQTVFIDERNPAEPYDIFLERLPFPMPFTVVDQHGRPVAGHPIRLDYQNRQLAVQADSQGRLALNDVYYGQQVQCYDTADKNLPLVVTHEHKRGQADYQIPVIISDPFKPVKRGFRYLGLLLLLLGLLVAGLIAYYYFVKKESLILSEAGLKEAVQETIDNIPVASCNGGQDGQNFQSREVKIVLAEYDLGKPGSTFLFDYYTDGIPDEIEVFEGCKDDIKEDSKSLFQYYGSTIKDSRSTEYMQEEIRVKGQFVTVRVTGQTIWNYRVNCPQD